MQRFQNDGCLTPLPVGGRSWPLTIPWSRDPVSGGAQQADGGAVMPEYGGSQTLAADTTLRLSGTLTVPADAAGQLLLRFDCVGCFAGVWINHKPAAAHTGSHTAWECPLDANAGETVAITLLLAGGENVFSPYQTAGIHRGLRLVEVPQTRLSRCTVRAGLRDREAALRVTFALHGAQPQDTLEAALYAQGGGLQGRWAIGPDETAAGAATLAVPQEPPVAAWDAEHPALYRLTLTLRRGDTVLETVGQTIGFTEIRMENAQMLWNGRTLKLRGVNYREPFPGEGRDLPQELRTLKAANVNYLRSLYYPYSEACLRLCDELGFYVEQCAPFQEVGQGIKSTQNTPAEAEGYRSQCMEMLRDGLSHPCVAIWSLGGDSSWGSNFRHCYRLVKETDPDRPVNFYYPMTVPEEEPELDVWSVALIDWRQPMGVPYDQMTIFHTHGARNEIGYEVGYAFVRKPVLHQAFAPPACYNRDEYQRDAGIREFWGQGISRFWNRMWETDNCLGGAVLAAADESGAFSPRLKDFRWGILDEKGNPKPEYHHLRMAYAPVVLEACESGEGGLALRFQNRFCHTGFAELACRWQAGGDSGSFRLSGAPGERASAVIPGLHPKPGQEITLTFEAAGFAHRIVIPAPAQASPAEQGADGGPYTLRNDGVHTVAENRRYRFVFNNAQGRLAEAAADGAVLLTDGPLLQAARLSLGAWKGTLESASAGETGACVTLLGAYDAVCRVRFTLRLQNDGTVDTRAEILTLSKPMPRSVKAGVGIDPGGLNEWGIAWLAAPGCESLFWRRSAPVSWYPQEHIGRAEGVAARDNRDDFTSMKHNVLHAALRYPGAGIAVPGENGALSVRAEEQEDPAFVLDDRDERIRYTGLWRRMDDACGNYRGGETLSDGKDALAELNFTGSGVRVYGPMDFLYGYGEASVDGGEVTLFCQTLDPVDRPGASRGLEKRYGQLLYEAHHLPQGPHTLRIRVKGESPAGAQGCYVSLDRIVVESAEARPPVRLIVNRDYNYARLVRGNYMRPRVAFAAGDSVSASIRLYGAQASGEGRKRQ